MINQDNYIVIVETDSLKIIFEKQIEGNKTVYPSKCGDYIFCHIKEDNIILIYKLDDFI